MYDGSLYGSLGGKEESCFTFIREKVTFHYLLDYTILICINKYTEININTYIVHVKTYRIHTVIYTIYIKIYIMYTNIYIHTLTI